MDVDKIKKDFPLFQNQPELVYLDSAATSLKPMSVIEKEREYYEKYSANVHRGIYELSEQATTELEKSRQIVAQFIGASDVDEIIFTRNATEGINLVASTLGRQLVGAGDRVVASLMEHHSNFVCWQQLSCEKNADFQIISIDPNGELSITDQKLNDLIDKKTKVIALTAASNVLGTINPLAVLIKKIKKLNPDVIIVVDAAQFVPCFPVNVSELNADFLAFSGHKILGPTGIGILWGKKTWLDTMSPYQFGGGMIKEVRIDKTIFAKSPAKFEAGTPHIAGAIALQEALHYLSRLRLTNIALYEQNLVSYAISRLKVEFGSYIKIYGPSEKEKRVGLLSFTFGKLHPHDVASLLNEKQIAVRAGHHCAMPLHQFLGVSATIRVSFYIYNNQTDVERLINGLKYVKSILDK